MSKFTDCLLLTVLVLAGCQNAISTQQAHDYTPLPDFILDVFTNDAAFSSPDVTRQVCVVIDQTEIWFQDDSIESLQDIIFETVSISVDGEEVEIADTLKYDTIEPVYDNVGNIIGEAGGEVTICGDVSHHSLGMHEATLMLSDTQGSLYSFDWQFEISRDGIENFILDR